MRKLVLALALVALAPFAFAACGEDDDEAAETATTTEETTEAGGGGGEEAGGGGAVAVSAVPDGSLAFEQDELNAPAGAATFEFTNPASLDHDFCIEEGGSEVGCADIVSDGDSSTLEADLEPGEYTFYCSVAGHREGGMEGTLTVE